MSAGDQSALKLRLYRDAVRAGIVRGAFRMARALCSPMGHGVYGLREGDITVTLSEIRPRPYVAIRYKGIPVLFTMKDNWPYLPGPWEGHFRELVAKAESRSLRPASPA